jgi:hypothetical protein
MKGTRRLRARIPVSIGFSYESLQREYSTPLLYLTILTKVHLLVPNTPNVTPELINAHYIFAYNYTTADGGK